AETQPGVVSLELRQDRGDGRALRRVYLHLGPAAGVLVQHAADVDLHGASAQLDHAHRVDARQVLEEDAPVLAAVAARPQAPAGRAEVEAGAALVRVRGHRLAEDGEPGVRARQAAVEALPALATVLRAIGGRARGRRGARPELGAVHRKDPHRVR